jgi:hypothetical protein
MATELLTLTERRQIYWITKLWLGAPLSTFEPWNAVRSRSRSYFTTDSQYVLVSSTLVELATRYYFLSNVSMGRPLWREDGSAICNVLTQWSESLRTRNHTLLSSEVPKTWSARFPYLYPPGTGWPSYTPRHWVPFTSPLTTRRASVEVFLPSPYLEGQVRVYIAFRNRMV